MLNVRSNVQIFYSLSEIPIRPNHNRFDHNGLILLHKWYFSKNFRSFFKVSFKIMSILCILSNAFYTNRLLFYNDLPSSGKPLLA